MGERMSILGFATPAQATLFVLILISRVGDVGSTFVATPTLKMEANPLMRIGGWRLAIASLLLCLIPFYDARLGMTVLVLSLLVTASNLSKGWLMRALGEEGYGAVTAAAVQRSSLMTALAFVLVGAASVGVAGLVMVYVSGGSGTWSYWAASGVVLYAVATAFYGSLAAIGLFRRVAQLRSSEGTI
jgi:hypothetical protein